jgi:heat shock protein HslJ
MPKKLKTTNKKVSSLKSVISKKAHLPYPLLFLGVIAVIAIVIALTYFQAQQYKRMQYMQKNKSVEKKMDTEKVIKPQVMRVKDAIKTTSWVWETTLLSDKTITTPVKKEAFVLTFNADGTFSSTTDCNGLGGTYLVSDSSRIGLFDMMSTEMYCDNSQEAVYIGQLSKIMSYSLEDTTLKFVLSDNMGTMVFKKK